MHTGLRLKKGGRGAGALKEKCMPNKNRFALCRSKDPCMGAVVALLQKKREKGTWKGKSMCHLFWKSNSAQFWKLRTSGSGRLAPAHQSAIGIKKMQLLAWHKHIGKGRLCQEGVVLSVYRNGIICRPFFAHIQNNALPSGIGRAICFAGAADLAGAIGCPINRLFPLKQDGDLGVFALAAEGGVCKKSEGQNGAEQNGPKHAPPCRFPIEQRLADTAFDVSPAKGNGADGGLFSRAARSSSV